MSVKLLFCCLALAFVSQAMAQGATSPRPVVNLNLGAIFKIFRTLMQTTGIITDNQQGTNNGPLVVPNPAVPLVSGELDAMFERIATVDERQCIPRLLCEIHAANGKRNLHDMEKVIVLLFQNFKSSSSYRSAASTYETAVTMGKALHDPAACQSVFPSCFYNSQQLLASLIE